MGRPANLNRGADLIIGLIWILCLITVVGDLKIFPVVLESSNSDKN